MSADRPARPPGRRSASASAASRSSCVNSILVIIYDRNGVNTDGPADRPLDLVKVGVQPNGDVTVTTGDMTKRRDDEPDQTVPYPV